MSTPVPEEKGNLPLSACVFWSFPLWLPQKLLQSGIEQNKFLGLPLLLAAVFNQSINISGLQQKLGVCKQFHTEEMCSVMLHVPQSTGSSRQAAGGRLGQESPGNPAVCLAAPDTCAREPLRGVGMGTCPAPLPGVRATLPPPGGSEGPFRVVHSLCLQQLPLRHTAVLLAPQSLL